MKKLFSILTALFLIATVATAQNISPTAMKDTWGQYENSGTASVSITNTTPKYLYTGPMIGFKDVANITVVATEVSGTTDALCTLEVSQDGVAWCDYYSSLDSSYTFDLADVTTAQVFRWKVTNTGDSYFRVKIVGVGTPSITVTGLYSAKVASRR